jgi:hypothetical protein
MLINYKTFFFFFLVGDNKSLLKVRGKVTNSHDGPGMRQKEREGSFCIQALLKTWAFLLLSFMGFFHGTGVSNAGLHACLTRQALYHLNNSTSPVLCWGFSR